MSWQFVENPPPHDKDLWVNITAQIKNNETGEIRQYAVIGIWDKEINGPNTYIWEEGNWSCDCNRCDFWHQSGGEEEWEESECGFEKFSVNLSNPETGEIFYREFTD